MFVEKMQGGREGGRDCKGLNFSSLEELHGGQLGVGILPPGGVGSAVSQAVLHLNQA